MNMYIHTRVRLALNGLSLRTTNHVLLLYDMSPVMHNKDLLYNISTLVRIETVKVNVTSVSTYLMRIRWTIDAENPLSNCIITYLKNKGTCIFLINSLFCKIHKQHRSLKENITSLKLIIKYTKFS